MAKRIIKKEKRRDGIFCMPWCIWSGDAKLSDDFAATAGSSVNPFHRRKCTAFGYGWPDLCRRLRACLELVNNGKAFQ